MMLEKDTRMPIQRTRQFIYTVIILVVGVMQQMFELVGTFDASLFNVFNGRSSAISLPQPLAISDGRISFQFWSTMCPKVDTE